MEPVRRSEFQPSLRLDSDRCARCGEQCAPSDEALVRFCDECLECSNLASYPEGWVTLGGWD